MGFPYQLSLINFLKELIPNSISMRFSMFSLIWKRTHFPGFPDVLESAGTLKMKILTISMFKWCNKQFSSKRFSKNILITLLVIFITTQKFYAVFMIFYAVRQFLWKLIILCSLGALTETSHKPLKVEAAKNSFPGVYIIDTTCFDECFLFHVMTGRYYF